MACNAPSYPPSGSGGWGSNWGASWGNGSSGGTWDEVKCITVEYVVTPTLQITYSVPITLDISYEVQYASALRIDYNIPPPLVIEYTVGKALSVGYDVPYTGPLSVSYRVPPPLRISYTVSTTAPLAVGYDVLYATPLTVTYDVNQSLTVGYTVPDAFSYLVVTYDVPSDHRSLVVGYDVGESFGLFCVYSVLPSTYTEPLVVVYNTTVGSMSAGLQVGYAVESPGSGTQGIDAATADGLVSMSVNASEGAININAVVLEGHDWSTASPGDILSGYVGGRVLSFKVSSITYDRDKCHYTIVGKHTVADLFSKLVHNDNNAIWVPDPVRERIEAIGSICIGDVKMRDDVPRPTVLSSIYAAAASAGVDVVVDPNIPGLDDLVPFDQFYGKDALTLGDVVRGLIGWAKPYYFLDGSTVRIIGGHPTGAIGAPPNNVDFNSRSLEEYQLPVSVEVGGGPWPDKYEPPPPSDDSCSTGAREPSELEDYVLHSTRVVGFDSSDVDQVPGGRVLERVIEKKITKQGGKLVSEIESYYITILVPETVSFDPFMTAGTRRTTVLAERTTTTYEYMGDCPDALSRKVSETYRTFRSLFSETSEVAAALLILEEGGLEGGHPVLYKRAIEEWKWNRKGYVEEHSQVTITAEQMIVTLGGADVIYSSQLTEEVWRPWGDGLWYHRVSAPIKRLIETRFPNSDPVTGGDQYTLHTAEGLESLSEITDSGPQTSDCVSPPPDCSPSCKATSSPRSGLTRYSEEVPIAGGTSPSISIRVPGINAYWPLPKLIHDGSTPPPMNVGQPYADYAARARKYTGSLRTSYLMCAGDSGTHVEGVVLESMFRLPGELRHGGLVTSSSLNVDSDGKMSGTYQITYFA